MVPRARAVRPPDIERPPALAHPPPKPSWVPTFVHAFCALLLVVLGARDGLQLYLPVLSWWPRRWDDPAAPAFSRTRDGLVNSLSQHRSCINFPLCPPVPLVGMVLVLAAVSSGRPAAARALRRAATVILTYPLGGIVEITFISLACAAAPFFPLTEVVLWLPPLLRSCCVVRWWRGRLCALLCRQPLCGALNSWRDL
jgi:hypothetical protein